MGRDVCATEPWVNFPAETGAGEGGAGACLLYTSDAADEERLV